MSSILLSSMFSALSYADSNEAKNLKEFMFEYDQQFPTQKSSGWGQQEFTEQYLENVEKLKFYQESGSFEAYIFADHNTKKLHVVFRGTQEPGDFIEDINLAFNDAKNQEVHVPKVVQDAYNYMQMLNHSNPGWIMSTTGHSLGGHLARTFSEIASAQEKYLERVVIFIDQQTHLVQSVGGRERDYEKPLDLV